MSFVLDKKEEVMYPVRKSTLDIMKIIIMTKDAYVRERKTKCLLAM